MDEVSYMTEGVVRMKSRGLWCFSTVLRVSVSVLMLLYLPLYASSWTWMQPGSSLVWMYSNGQFSLNSTQPFEFDLDFFSPNSQATTHLFLPTRSKTWKIKEFVAEFPSDSHWNRLKLTLNWDCHYHASDCRPTLSPSFLTSFPPQRHSPHYFHLNSTLYRDLYSATGVEVEVVSTSHIEGLSLLMLVMHVSLLCVLLYSTDYVVDFYAENWFYCMCYADRYQFRQAKYSQTDIPPESFAILSTPVSSLSSVDDFL